MIIGNQKFRAKFEIDETAATIMRMAGAIFFGSFLMALYIMFVRPNGVEGTWAFFNLIFVQNISWDNGGCTNVIKSSNNVTWL